MRGCYDSEEMRQLAIQEEGRAAYTAEISIIENPYPFLTVEWENWMEGWQLQHKETNNQDM